MVRPVLDAVAQHVDHAALGDLALQPGEELLPRGPVVIEIERLASFGWVAGRKTRSWTRSTAYSRS